MGKTMVGTVLLFLLGIFETTSAAACGDKLVSMSRGVRFQRACAVRPGKILLCLSTTQADAGTARALRSLLSRVGHKVTMVGDIAGVRHELTSERYDLVLAGLTTIDAIEGDLARLDSKPTVVPVLVDASDEEIAKATSRFEFALSLPSRANDQIRVVDKAMQSVKGTTVGDGP
jgi:hypothetical protein